MPVVGELTGVDGWPGESAEPPPLQPAANAMTAHAKNLRTSPISSFDVGENSKRTPDVKKRRAGLGGATFTMQVDESG